MGGWVSIPPPPVGGIFGCVGLPKIWLRGSLTSPLATPSSQEKLWLNGSALNKLDDIGEPNASHPTV